MNKLNLKNKKQGFTIIEVVLVLAIAGLIFLIVFLALPGLQRSRRDTQRKSTFGNITAALENYASNNGGQYPGGQGTTGVNIDVFLSGFTPTSDPQGSAYKVYSPGNSAAPTTAETKSTIDYEPGGTCSTSTGDGTYGGYALKASTVPTVVRSYAISMQLESGTVCQQQGS